MENEPQNWSFGLIIWWIERVLIRLKKCDDGLLSVEENLLFFLCTQ